LRSVYDLLCAACVVGIFVVGSAISGDKDDIPR
jgi:hypothetical protein